MDLLWLTIGLLCYVALLGLVRGCEKLQRGA
jgi:hypothetical protein